jgi:hypothetical protein
MKGEASSTCGTGKPASPRSISVRVPLFVKAGIASAACMMIGVTAIAQSFVTPGPNVNLIGSTPEPDQTYNIADTGLKQQQEPSCIVRPSNRAYIMCAFNDLRASDKPSIQGDSWIGYSESGDKGVTYKSYLVPGFKSHPNSLNMGFAADPTLVAIPGSYAVAGDPSTVESPGISVLNYIGANRDSNVGVLVAQRFVDNEQEDERHNLPEVGSHIIADGSGGRFIDKPAFLWIPDGPGSQSYKTESITVEGRDEPISVRTASGTLVVAYAVFTGNDDDGGNSTKVYAQFSNNNGVAWSNPKKLSESLNEVTGVSLSAIGQTVVATWRRKADNNENDAIVRAVAAGNLNKWSKPEVVFEFCPIDQPATGVSFRSFSFPWTANDGNRFWTFVADRRFDVDGQEITSCDPVPEFPGVYEGIPRIVGMSSPDGINWYGDAINEDIPFVVNANKDSSGKPVGFQLMPSAIGIKNRIDLAWYDTRREELGAGLPPQGAPDDPQIPLVYDYASTDLTSLARVLRKADVWMTRLTASCGATGGCTPSVEAPVRVSKYAVALIDNTDDNYALPFETEAHIPNHRLYASGTLAFKGDYIAIAAPWVRKTLSGVWLSNSLPFQPGLDLSTYTPLEDVVVAWGDNRDVRVDYNWLTSNGDPEQVPYTPPGGPSQGANAFKLGEIEEGAGEPLVPIRPELSAVTEPDDSADPNTPADDSIVACTPDSDFSRSRDSNIYGSVVADSPTLVAPTNTKPLGTIQRMFPLVLSNPDTTSAKNFCLVISNQPQGAPVAGRASFFQLPAIPPFDVPGTPPALTRLPVSVGPGNTESRAIFVFASEDDVIRVDAYEDNSTTEQCADDLASNTFTGTLQNSIFISDGSLLDPGYCEENPGIPACQPTSIEETHNISLASLNLQAPVLKASVTRALNLQALNLQAPPLGALNLQALNLQALPPEEYAELLAALNLQALNLQALNLQALNLQALNLQALNLQALNLQALNLQALNLQALNLQALNLQALNLQALNLQAPSLGDGSDPTSPTAQLEAAVVADDVYYQDVTYIVNTDANVTTTYSADIALDVDSLKTGPDDEDPVVQLIAWTANSVNSTSQGSCGQPQPGFQAQVLAFTTLDALNLQAVDLPQTISPDNQNPFVGSVSFTGKPNQKIALTARIWATGGTKDSLDQLFSEWVDCMNDPQAAEDPAFCSNAGVGSKISFGASSQSCATSDKIDPDTGLPLYDSSDCLNNENEKIFQDRQPPNVNPVNPPDGFTPGTLPYNLDPLLNTLTVTWPIDGSDADATSIIFECTIAGTSVFPDSQSVDGDLFSATFSYDFGPGITPVSCDVTDGAGNTTTVTFDIEVFDVTGPQISVPAAPAPASTDATGFASPDLDAGVSATDNVGVASLSCSASPYPLPVGPNLVTCTAADGSGNTTIATYTITVLDATAPEISVPAAPPTVSTDATGFASPDLDAGVSATDNVGVASLSCSASPYPLPVGSNQVNCTAEDAAGNTTTATYTITVVDATAPEILVPTAPPPVPTDATGFASPDLKTGVVANDNVGVVDLSCTVTPYPLPAGSHLVTCTATDAAGNSATASYTITVVDATAPLLVVPTDFSFDTDATGFASPNLEAGVSATDNTGVASVSCSASPYPLPVGPNLVTCTALDVAGNIATATYTITVADATAPTLLVPADFEVDADPDGTASPDLSLGVIANDNVGVTSLSCTADPFPLVVGSNLVTCAAVDDAGNSVSDTYTITVLDASGPTITARDVELFVDYVDDQDPDWGSVPDIVDAAEVTAIDAVDGVITDISCVRDVPNDDPALTDTDFEFSDTPYSITCTAADSAGNPGTASLKLTVSYLYDIDVILPKGNIRAGSTIPIDIQYLAWGNGPVDGSEIDIKIFWASTDDCETPNGLITGGDDSGDSKFRWSDSNMLWQYSWQTKDENLTAGDYLVIFSPSGAGVANATECVTLR